MQSHIRLMTSHVSCGVCEIGSLLDDPKKNMWEIANHFYHPAHGAPEAFIMASDSPGSRSDILLGEMLKQGFLTHCVQTTTAINPKTGSTIQVWVGRVNHEAYKTWYMTESVRRIKRRLG